GKTTEAEQAFRRTIALDPNYVDGYHYLSLILIDQGRLTDAESTLREANRQIPKDPELYQSLAVVLHRQGRRSESPAIHEQAIFLCG
ncbi:MAG: tetratricopeptide repeat protein, partial [Phormidesmis sp.]